MIPEQAKRRRWSRISRQLQRNGSAGLLTKYPVIWADGTMMIRKSAYFLSKFLASVFLSLNHRLVPQIITFILHRPDSIISAQIIQAHLEWFLVHKSAGPDGINPQLLNIRSNQCFFAGQPFTENWEVVKIRADWKATSFPSIYKKNP